MKLLIIWIIKQWKWKKHYSIIYKIPKTTFINNLDCLRTRGRKPFLSEEIEKKLTEGCLSLANKGFGIDKKVVVELVQNIFQFS